MSRKPAEIDKYFEGDDYAKYVAHFWNTYNTQRYPKIEQWKELRNYIFATDTKTTSNRNLPWKNSTTLPKLCQIRDNLHSNYISALFPNDEWLRWEPYTKDDAYKAKRMAIEAYMSNKTRTGHFRTEMSKLLLDYIDYGNCFATVEYENSVWQDDHGQDVIDYIGPKAKRISPMDIVFNLTAGTFKDSPKVIRTLRTIGELMLMAKNEPDNVYLREALKRRDELNAHMIAYGVEDFHKAEGMLADGFGNYAEYLQSGYVEILEFYGDIHNQDSNTLEEQRVITVVDRCYTIRNEAIPSWNGSAPIFHAGWRSRPDNLYAMGPLDNLVGMQYRIDHLENLKADAMDLAVMPPIVITGDVEAFTWGPGAEINVGEGGNVVELAKNVQWVIQADNAIDRLEQRMEMYAGAPREAMGIRTAGEKTAFEVEQLQNAAGRIFQEKITHFEIELLENILNAMLETSKRNMDGEDVVRVMDDDLGVQQFTAITKSDITASGKLRPIGARHFAAQATLMQNLTGVFNSPVGQLISPHVSAKNLARLVEDILGLSRYQLVSPNVAVFEQQETQRLVGQAQEDSQTEQAIPLPQ